ncbi:hypothetical protein [Lacticaseibacillus sp. N501-2]|uniref:hypothetical protein n=1 Tax=Lacticaseibacillus salsurae TaxID=3367729 RepID=UPI0038B33218
MDALRKHILIVVSTLLVFIAGSFFVAQQPVQAANSYDGYTVVGDLGIPQDVVSVMIANSLDANGKTPNVSASSLTIGDVSQWQTVSLATRKQKSDGSYASTTNSTVAGWVGGLATNSDDNVKTSDMYLFQSLCDGSFPVLSFLTGGNMYNQYTLANLPVLNRLMLVLMTAKNAKTIDLTGMVSKVSIPANRLKILDLFQTKTMPNLTELDLGSNAIGPGLTDSSWAYYMMWSSVLASKSVVTWDLSYEGFTSLDNNLLSQLGSQTRNVNLSSNTLTSIGRNNGDALDTGGDIDLSGNGNLNSDDSSTLWVLAKVISTGGDTVLPDSVANAVVSKAVNSYDASMTSAGINAVASQLTTETLTTIVNSKDASALLPGIDPSKLSADAVQQLDSDAYEKILDHLPDDKKTSLEEKRQDASGSQADKASVSVAGNWNFGNYILGQTTSMTSPDAVKITGTLPAGQRLSVTMSDWTSGNREISPQLSLPAGDNGWSQLSLTADDSSPVLTNNSSATMQFSQTLTSPTLNIPQAQGNAMTVGATYTGTLTWSIENVPSVSSSSRRY